MELYYYNDISGTGEWNNPLNWWDGDGPSGSNGYLPNPGDTLYIKDTCTIGIPGTLEYFITITGSGYLLLDSTHTQDVTYITTVDGNGILDITGTFNNGSGLYLYGTSIVNVSGTLTMNNGANGIFVMGSAAILNIAGGSCSLFSDSTTNGTINISSNGYLYTYGGTLTGTIVVGAGNISLSETILTTTSFTLASSSTFNLTSCTINTNLVIPSGCTVTMNGNNVLENTINNNGTITCENLSNGIIVNNSSFNLSQILQCASFTNNATFTSGTNSTIKIATFVNNSTLTLDPSSSLTFTGTSVFTNNGVFTHGSYSTRFRGRIFPQIPSSASWGNALL